MSGNTQQVDSIWESLEDDPVRVENLKLRSALMMSITEQIQARGLTQVQAAGVLKIAQPRVSALMSGKIEDFRLDALVDFAHRLGMQVSLEVAPTTAAGVLGAPSEPKVPVQSRALRNP